MGGLDLDTEDQSTSASRRTLLASIAALTGAAIAKLAGADEAQAGHNTDIAYDSQTVLHADVTNTTSGSTRVSSNISGTAAFVALNNYPVGISRPDGMLGRTAYTTSSCAGVAGACEAASGGIGVLGTAKAANGVGVFGFAGSVVPSETMPPGTGVFAKGPNQGVVAEAVDGVGVLGRSPDQAVVGAALQGVGVEGFGPTTGTGVGGVAGDLMPGESEPAGTGVFGRGPDAGVVGRSLGGAAVRGDAGTGTGVLGTAGAGGIAGRFVGRTIVEGNLEVVGGLSTTVAPTAAGVLYAQESPEPWVEDFGEAKLVKGRAIVRLRPDFDALVSGTGYQVFLTEYGNKGGLYVARRSAHSFQVRSRRRGARGRFGYRVLAKRPGVAARSARVERPPAVDYPEIASVRKGRRPGAR
jgi:hypothetical protein